MRTLIELLWRPEARTRLLVLAVAGVLAVVVGFRVVTPAQAQRLITHGGYYYILAVFVAWVACGWRVLAARREVATAWLWRPGATGAFLVGALLVAVGTDTFAHKVLFDEYVIQGTAWHLHLTKEVAAPIRAYDFAGTWTVVDTFLDKRPYFFPFLVSLLHDLTGFRISNAHVLNVGAAAVVLAALCWVVLALTGRRGPAWLAVAGLATLPLFGQGATGASLEVLNLAMIGTVMVAAVLYLRAPDDDRLGFLVCGTVLLAQTRYESVLYVVPVAVIVVLGWRRAGRVLLPWPALVAPLLLVPYAWHDRFVASRPVLWQLREGETARFATRYLTGNLEGAANFFLSTSPLHPNSLWLTVAGGLGLGWLAWRAPARRGGGPGATVPVVVVLLTGATVAANLGMLMFYYWSRLDEPIAARFALPSYLLLAVVAGWAAHGLDGRGWPATRVAAGALAAWVLAWGAPAYAHRFYTEQNLVMHELDWQVAQLEGRAPGTLLITSKATMPFLMRRIPAVNTALARGRADQIRWHLEQGTFREVIVSQVLRPLPEPGEVIVDPEDDLPERFRLEPVAEKRFGGRWIRLSRLTGLEPVPPVKATATGR
jgi:hypothetical protein